MRVDGDFYRDTLDDFGEVAGGVIRRKQGKLFATGGGNAVDDAMYGYTREGVNIDGNGLAGTHVRKLRLLVVCGDIDGVQRHHSHELRPSLNVLPDAQGAVRNGAINRGGDGRVAEIELRLMQRSLLLGECRLRLRESGAQHLDLFLSDTYTNGVARERGLVFPNLEYSTAENS